jgi:hypothetical protein
MTKSAVRVLGREGHHNAVTFDDIGVGRVRGLGRRMILKCSSKNMKRIEVPGDKFQKQAFVFHKMELVDNVSIFS